MLTAERPRSSLAAVPSDDLARLTAASAVMPAVNAPFRVFEPIPGGLTNRNYRIVTSDGIEAVARISEPESGLLRIDRDAEFANASRAAERGVGPKVLGYAPGAGVSVVEWISGHTFSEADLDDATTLGRVAEAARRLHAGPRFVTDFDMVTVQAGYRALVRERGFRVPANYDDYLPQLEIIRRALAVSPQPTVPCHNDLLAANLMDDGTRIWIIDYEYAGNNDPYFELGNIWSESDLPAERLEDLVDAYVGAHSPALIARARLYALMSRYGWTLWAAIQDSVSDVDFAFWSWGMHKYDRAEADFRPATFDRLISDATQRP